MKHEKRSKWSSQATFILVPPLDLEMRGAFRDLPQSTEAEHIC